MQHKGTITIRTDRLVLRRFTLEDAPAMFRNWAHDADVTHFLMWPPHQDLFVTQNVVKRWIEGYCAADFYTWAIELKDLDEPIGSISAVRIHESTDCVEIGYCLGKAWWHQGIMTEAFRAVIAYFFREIGANRIQARHDPRNPHSGDVMKKCGLRYEGTLRQADINNQGLADLCYYGLLREEYFAPKQEITYEKRGLDPDTVEQLIEMSRLWEAEGCSYGLRANTREDLMEPLYVALDGERMVGYIFGKFYKTERRTSYIRIGEKCFSVEELYVLPDYRSKGIGRKLFSLLEAEVKDQAAYLTLATSTKDYRKVLRFYTEEAGMRFHDAFLIKEEAMRDKDSNEVEKRRSSL